MPDSDAGSDPAATDGSRRGMPRWAKVILWLVVIALVIVVLFTTVFPWVEERMQDPTMGASAAAAADPDGDPIEGGAHLVRHVE